MARLTQSDKYAIEFLYSKKKTVEEIAKELDVPLTQVKKIVGSLAKSSNDKVAETKKDNTKELMIRQTSAKKNNSVAIMTQSAAQLADEFAKNMPTVTKNTDHYIYRRPE